MNQNESKNQDKYSYFALVLAFVCGIFFYFILDKTAEQLFPEENPVLYVRMQDFLGEQIPLYGEKAESEEDRIFYARSFNLAVEKSLEELAVIHGTAIFVDPAVIVGGIDMTPHLEKSVALKMSELISSASVSGISGGK